MTSKPFSEYHRLIHRLLHTLPFHPPYEDEVQDAYFIYHRALESYDPSLSEFSTFFYSRLRYHYLSEIRKREQQKKTLTRYLVLHPSSHIDHYFLHPPMGPREESILTYSLEGYTTDDIASLLNLSKSTILRERKKLRQKLSFYVLPPKD